MTTTTTTTTTTTITASADSRAALQGTVTRRNTHTIRRLWRDFDELSRCPLEGISAAPLPQDVRIWHANIAPASGNYAGLVLHLVLTFEEGYPSTPPQVRLCTNIPHSNVIPRLGSEPNFICIDMLRNFFFMGGGEDASRPYEGWSTAYSVSCILLQLQCFLFDEFAHNYDGKMKNTLWDHVVEEGGGRRPPQEVRKRLQRAQEEAESLRCECGHGASAPWPSLPECRSSSRLPRPLRVPGVQLVGDVVRRKQDGASGTVTFSVQ